MQLSCFLEPQMLLQYNLSWLLKEQFSIAKELLECIQSCLTHLRRYHINFSVLHASPSLISQSSGATRNIREVKSKHTKKPKYSTISCIQYSQKYLTFFKFLKKRGWLWDIWFMWSAGGYRDYICCSTDFYLFSSVVFDDWIPMDSSKVLLFLLLHIHVFHLFLHVWHDGCCFDSWLSNCCHCHVLLSQFLELVLRFPCSTPGMLSLNQTTSNHFLYIFLI